MTIDAGVGLKETWKKETCVCVKEPSNIVSLLKEPYTTIVSLFVPSWYKK